MIQREHRDPGFLLLMAGGCASFVGVSSFNSIQGFLELDPGNLQRVPLSYQEFVFGVSGNATRNVAESEVKGLSKL